MNALNKRICAGLVVIGLCIPAAYVTERMDREQGLESGKVISVKDQQGRLVSLMGVEVVRFLRKQQFPSQNGSGGPTLSYAVGAAGLGSFGELEVKGLDSAQTYRADQQETQDSLVLECNQRGTVTLMRVSGSKQALVDDVSEIIVIR